MGHPTCYLHPEAKASGSCHRCLRPICTVCGLFDGGAEHCPSCHQAVRRGRARRRTAILALVGVVLALAVFNSWRRARGTLPAADGQQTFDYGRFAEQVAALRKGVEREPCDRTLIIRYTDRLLEAGDSRGALAASDAFTAKCGEYPRLWWQTYTAHKRLSELEAAAADATRL